jgi:hypothetical protein
MASYRKKFASLEADNPVTTPPIETAKLPPVTETPPKLDEPPKENPVEQAAQAEITKRLAEMKQASEMAAGPQPQRPQSPPRADGGIEDMIREWNGLEIIPISSSTLNNFRDCKMLMMSP